MNKLKKKCDMQKSYSIGNILELGWNVFLSKFIDRSIRIIRRPFTLRGRKYIDFGMSLTTGVGCRCDCVPGIDSAAKKLVFGKNVQINDYVHIVAMEKVTIGDDVLMASHVFISDNSHGSYKGDELDSDPRVPPIQREYRTSPVTIGKSSWIGEGVIIMPGVSIGEGCVIGAHSIVNRDIPNYTVAVGTPIRLIKRYDFETRRWMKIDS